MDTYILNQWKMAKVSADWVMSCVPKFINAEQCAVILNMPQTGLSVITV